MDQSIGRAGPFTASDAHAGTDRGLAARAGAGTVLLGTVITTVGLSWDVQWHVDVGPDTFFTLPHLFLYAGSAVSGIASLVMVLLSTGAQRAGRPWEATVGGVPVRVLGGTFRAPLGYLLSGTGAALFLLYGLLDLWWHTVYGFDATLKSPPHVALFLSISITMIGGLVVFSAARAQAWGRLGIVAAVPLLIIFLPVASNGLAAVPLPIDPVALGIVFFTPLVLLVGAAVLARPGAAVLLALVLAVLQGVLWWFSPWAAHAYAASVGLPLREGLSPQPPQLPSSIPMFLLVGALATELLFHLARRRGADGKSVMWIAGLVTGLVVGISLPLQLALTDPTSGGIAPLSLLVLGGLGLPLGALAGFLAGRFAAMLRTAVPSGVTP